jgi:hypothetical protein
MSADKPKAGHTIAYMEARADTGEHRVSDPYHTDFGRWAADQASALRVAAHTAGNLPVDWENVAEEIEALAKAQQRDLASRIATILVHLIKLQASTATNPRNTWRRTVRTQRTELHRLLKDEATLSTTVSAVIEDEIAGARQHAADDIADYGEVPSVDVARLAFTEDQVLGRWFPGDE